MGNRANETNCLVTLVEVEIADRLAGIGRLFRPFYRLLEFFFHEFGGVSLILNRLPEDGIAAIILLFHSARGFFNVVESLGLDGCGVGNDSSTLRIHFQHCVAAWAGDIEC